MKDVVSLTMLRQSLQLAVAGLLISLGAQGAMAAPVQTAKAASQSCKGLNFAGTYKVTGDDQAKILIKQSGCTIQVTEVYPHDTDKVWVLDLTGKRPLPIPKNILEVNEGSALGYAAIKSLRVLTSLEVAAEPNGENKIHVDAKLNLPIVGKNKIDTDLALKGEIVVGANGSNADATRNVTYIYFGSMKARMVAARSPTLFGPLAAAFVKGANYIFGLLDEVNSSGLVLGDSISYMREQ